MIVVNIFLKGGRNDFLKHLHLAIALEPLFSSPYRTPIPPSRTNPFADQTLLHSKEHDYASSEAADQLPASEELDPYQKLQAEGNLQGEGKTGNEAKRDGLPH